MRIAFDPQIFALQEYGGISRYFCSLAGELSMLANVETKIFAPLHINAYLPTLPSTIVSGRKIRRLPKTARLRAKLSMMLARPEINRFKPDIVHETYYSAHSFAPQGARRVITVYDMIHEKFSGEFLGSDTTYRNKAIAVARADHVICISENTRKDLIDILNVAPEKTSVSYLGYTLNNANGFDTPRPSESPYLLYVGQRAGYKNFDGLLRAYASSAVLKNNCKLVCFGGGAFGAKEIKSVADLGLSADQVIQIGGGDHILAALYKHALAFVYPSLYEGFGIPPLEAMSYQCPVICSNTSSMPEVAGNAAEYFDPLDIENIRDAIERVVESRNDSQLLVARGLERVKQFSWNKCAQETQAIYGLII
ncbi:MAG: glycosyltransferase family 1 protein [Burkholderiales bacterium]